MLSCAHCGFETEEDFAFCPKCGTQRVGAGRGSPMIGRTLAGKYRLLEEIGAGSMGTVYLAEHIALKKRIAIKILHRELQVGEDALKRFQREGIAAGQFSHANAIQIFDFDKDEDGLFFLAMEYVEGKNLKVWLQEHGALPPDEAVELCHQLVSTLVEAHRHGIIHRDLKPENLMVVDSAAGERTLKVLDFGLSKLVDRPLAASLQTMPGRILGTPLYMSPEQWRAEDVDHRADIYAAALILYEMVAGAPPFGAGDITEAMQLTTATPPPSLLTIDPQLRIPVDLDAIVQKGLAKNREDRFQSATLMLDALEDIRFERIAHRPARRRRQHRSRATTAAQRQHLIPLAVAAALVLVAITAAWFAFGATPAADGAVLVSQKNADARTEDERNYLDLLRAARDSLSAGDTAGARVTVEKAMRMECADAEGYCLRADVYRARDDIDTALADYREALALYPSYAIAAARIGWIEFARGEVDAARTQFEAACKMDANCGDAVAGRAAVLSTAGHNAEALEVLDAAKGAGGTLMALWRGRVLLARDDLAGAVLAFVRAKQSDSNSWEACEGLGDAYRSKADPEAAETQYRAALEIDPQARGPRLKLLELLLESDRFGDAATAIEPALKHPDADIHVINGVIERGLAHPDAAIAALQTGLAQGHSEPARVHLLVAGLQLQQDDFASAARHCQAATEIDDTRGDAYSLWGLALFRLGEYRNASMQLERAVELSPTDTFALYTLGVIYKDYLGDEDRARRHFTAYREHGGSNPRVDTWLR